MGTITKALEILNYFSRSTPELGLSEVVRLTGRDKATVHRHLVELLENGYLEQRVDTRAYRLGPAILRLASVREATMPVRRIVRPLVEALSAEVGELVHFSMLQGDVLSPVSHSDPARHGTQVHFDESEMLPLHATSSGLAVLAFAPEKLRKAVLGAPLPAYASRTITDPLRLSEAISAVRSSGLGRTEKTFDDEVTSQSAPVFGPDKNAIGAVAVAMPVARMTEARRIETAAALRRSAVRMTAALGGAMPEELARLWGLGAEEKETMP